MTKQDKYLYYEIIDLINLTIRKIIPSLQGTLPIDYLECHGEWLFWKQRNFDLKIVNLVTGETFCIEVEKICSDYMKIASSKLVDVCYLTYAG